MAISNVPFFNVVLFDDTPDKIIGRFKLVPIEPDEKPELPFSEDGERVFYINVGSSAMHFYKVPIDGVSLEGGAKLVRLSYFHRE